MNWTGNYVRYTSFVVAAICATICNSATSQHPTLQTTSQDVQRNILACILLTDPDGWSVDVWEPGKYCIEKNLNQSWPDTVLPHQRLPRSALISIYSSNISVDLKGHQLSSTTPIHSGVYTNFPSNEKIFPTTIKNGKIITADKPTVFMVDMWNLGNKRFGRSYSLASPQGEMSKYKPTAFILENLTIKGNQHAIIMQGKNNIIRNCTIIGGNGTVNIYGPNLIFENNTIILNAKKSKTPGDEQPIALYLEDAAESIVRNNKIVINGSRLLNSEAIVLTNSQNVLIEKNMITGTKKVYRLRDEQSSAKVIGNDAN